MPVLKCCQQCGASKELAEFNNCKPSKDGKQRMCRICEREYKQKNKAKIHAQQREYRTINKDKESERTKLWAAQNRDRKLRLSSEYYHKNKERLNTLKAKYRRENKDKIKQQEMRYRGLKIAQNAKRKRHIKRATPQWVNHDQIKAIYVMASFLSSTTFGDGYHVDHIIPIKGQNVCGLHVTENLQVLRAKDNLSKGNSYAGL